MRVLVASAHPDDETLGCGGTLLKHVKAGDEVFWLIATAPVGPRWTAEQLRREKETVRAVASAYRISKCFELGFPSTELDRLSVSELAGAVRKVMEEVNPEIVYTVSRSDVHTDHQRLFDALFVVLKPFKDWAARRSLAYECLSSTDAAPPIPALAFVPNVYSDITVFLEEKLRIMRLYETELHPEPLPRSESAIRALARFRGATVGTTYAEAFVMIREIF